jgi:hypothetical protein
VTTQELYRAHLERRVSDGPRYRPGEIRLSEVGTCQRKASLRILGRVPERDDLTQASIYLRGDEHEDRVAEMWEAAYPGQVERQLEVRSPWGTGHADLWVRPLGHMVECKSTDGRHRQHLPYPSHVAQVTIYQHYRPEFRASAEIAYRFDGTGEIVSVPVAYDQALAEELVARLRRLRDALDHGLPLEIPADAGPGAYPCAWTRDGVVRRCGFWQHCWTQETDTAHPVHQRLLAQYRRAEEAVATARRALDEATADREGVRTALGIVMDRADVSALAHQGFEVRRGRAGRWTARVLREA